MTTGLASRMSTVPIVGCAADVIAKAQELGSVLVSLNGDFANIVTYRPTCVSFARISPASSCIVGH